MQIMSFLDGLYSCDFEFVPLPEFGQSPVAWIYPKNSILKPLFDKGFLEAGEKGIRSRVEEQRLKESCKSEKFNSVNFSFTAIFFAILCLGFFMSIMTFFIELIWSNMH